MILGLEPLAFASLLTLASAGPNSACKMPKPTEINVIPKTKPVRYDTMQTLADIQKTQVDTINPYGFGAQTHTNGYMKGGVGVKQNVRVGHQQIWNGQAVCVWYDKIDITIEIDPTIVIASELKKDRCKFDAVKEHELKHVMVDRKVVNKYAKTMGKKIYDGLQARGFIVGPLKAEYTKDIIKRMQEAAWQLIELEQKKMQIERAEMQQAVDTIEEYERVSSVCDKSHTHRHR